MGAPSDDDVRRVGEALQPFAEAMKAAAAEFEKAADNTGRSGVASALKAVHDLMVAVEIPLDRRAPIIAMARALVALDEGRQTRLVQPTPSTRGTDKRGKKPKLGDDVWVPRAAVAAAVELRSRAIRKQRGKSDAVKEAARWVAQRVRSWGIFTTKGDRAAALLRWREEIMARPTDDLARRVFALYTEGSEDWSALRVLEVAPRVWGIARQVPETDAAEGNDA